MEKIKLNDRAYKHFFIAQNYGKIEEEEQNAFLKFLYTKSPTSNYTKDLNHYVEIAKHNTQWRHIYMDWARDLLYEKKESKQEGIEIGRTEGMIQNKQETAQNFLAMKVLNDEQIAQGTGLSLAEVLEIKKQMAI